MTNLFSEYTLRNTVFKNRIVMAPMCMYSSDESGNASQFHEIHYATRAIGGVGLIILEASAICQQGRISNRDLGIWSDEHVTGLAKISHHIKKYNAIAGIQINHAGRKCDAGHDEIYGPSAIAFSDSYLEPKAMSTDQIKRTVEQFKEAAVRAMKAGYEYIEIHAAHGYLLSSFLSPLSNQRNDVYGGSYQNRARILIEVIDAIRSEYEGVLGVRISASDYVEDGNTVDDLVDIIHFIKDQGVDIVNVSSGGVVSVVPKSFPGYQIPFAQTIKDKCNIPVMGGGQIKSAELMSEVIENQRVDMVYIGRELLRNPYLPMHIAQETKANVEWIESYSRAIK